MTGDRQMLPVQTTSTRIVRAWQSPRTRYAAVWVVVTGFVLVLGAVGWLGFRAATVLASVERAQDHVRAASQAYEQRDLATGAEHVGAATAELRTARRASSDPVWAVAGTAPLVGDDVAAVAAVVSASAGLLDALDPVAARAGEVDLTAGGATALTALLQDPATGEGLRLGHERALTAVATAEDLQRSSLHPRVAEQVTAFADQLSRVEPALGAGASASRLLPVVLGSGEARELLVVVQTPAEVRSLGGLAGLVLVVRAEDGVLQVQESYAGSSVDVLDAPALSSPDLEDSYALVGDRAGRYLVNATMVPDVAQASSLLAAGHVARGGAQPDAVVLTDLGVLSGLLTVTGPVVTTDGTELTAANSDDLLQNGVYVAVDDPEQQDEFFAAAATAVVDRLLAPGVDPVALVAALADDARAGRLTLWSPDVTTQADIATAGLAGDRLADPTAVGLFLNDATGAKMQYFLRSDAALVNAPDGGTTLRLSLTSTVTDPDRLPDYVTGGYERLGLERGDQQVQVMVQGPVGGGAARWRLDGEPVAVGSAVLDGRGVGVLSVDVPAGGAVTLEVDLTGDATGGLVATPSVVVAAPEAG